LILIYFNALFVNPSIGFSESEVISELGEIQGLVDEGDIPSLHICVVSGDEILWNHGFGEETSDDAVFLIGSIQKMFVSISILQLYEEGMLGLDDNVNKYLPFELVHPDYPDASITVRMLLSHRSGLVTTPISEFCFDWDGLYYPEYSRYYFPSVIGVPLGDYLSMCLSQEGNLYNDSNWLFEPGTQYGYSNIGYHILEYIIETVSNQTISEYMNYNILKPLKMNNTGFNSSEYIENHATPHTRTQGNSTNKVLSVWNGRYMLRSTGGDMGHLLIALINNGEFDGIRILESDTVSLMFENTNNDFKSILRIMVPLKELRRPGYGLGVEVCNNGIYGHGGSTVGFTAECFFNPSKKIGYVRLSNVNAIVDYTSTGWEDINRVTNEIRTIVLTERGMLPQYDYALYGLAGIGMLGLMTSLYRINKSRK